MQSNVIIPYKKYRKKPLTPEQKEHNRRLASFRMRVENKIREVKDYVPCLPQFSEKIQPEIIAGIVARLLVNLHFSHPPFLLFIA
ncbi:MULTISPECIES: transposase family protein [unclassified Wolbachia]|uniref:transposase family protein n=1 Tax=unclassified Wolbachia TaxID=2640676 RepID=UPI00222635B3|nr:MULTISPECIES: transposase family protein [unclassified Wolbachia]